MIMLFPVWFGTVYEPALLLEYSDFFLMFFGLPFAIAAILYVQAARLDRKERTGSKS